MPLPLVLAVFAVGPHAAPPAPRRITADFRAAKLEDVLIEVHRQTGRRLWIDDNHGNHFEIKRTFTRSFRDATYSEVVDAICRQCGAQTGLGGGYLWPFPAGEIHSSCHGVFRLSVEEVARTRRLTFGERGARSVETEVRIELQAEPGIKCELLSAGVRHAKDDRDVQLKQETGVGHRMIDGSLVLYLKDAPKARRLAVLEGWLRVRVEAGPGPHVIDVPFKFRDVPLP